MSDIPKDVFENILFDLSTREAINLSATSHQFREWIECFQNYWYEKCMILKKKAMCLRKEDHVGPYRRECVMHSSKKANEKVFDVDYFYNSIPEIQRPTFGVNFHGNGLKIYEIRRNWDLVIQNPKFLCLCQSHHKMNHSQLGFFATKDKNWMWEFLFESYRVACRKNAYQKKKSNEQLAKSKEQLNIDITKLQNELRKLQKSLHYIEKLEESPVEEHPFAKSTPKRYLKK